MTTSSASSNNKRSLRWQTITQHGKNRKKISQDNLPLMYMKQTKNLLLKPARQVLTKKISMLVSVTVFLQSAVRSQVETILKQPTGTSRNVTGVNLAEHSRFQLP